MHLKVACFQYWDALYSTSKVPLWMVWCCAHYVAIIKFGIRFYGTPLVKVTHNICSFFYYTFLFTMMLKSMMLLEHLVGWEDIVINIHTTYMNDTSMSCLISPRMKCYSHNHVFLAWGCLVNGGDWGFCYSMSNAQLYDVLYKLVENLWCQSF